MTPNDVTLAILAGGASSRMGEPKAGLAIEGLPIIERLLRRMEWAGPTMLVLAPKQSPPPEASRFRCVAHDEIAGQGPLRGVLTALRAMQTRALVVATVDMPAIARVHLAWLVERLFESPQRLGVMCRRTAAAGSLIEPFPSAFGVAATDVVEQALAVQRRAMHALLDASPQIVAVNAPTEWPGDVWTNLNTPQDVQDYLQR